MPNGSGKCLIFSPESINLIQKSQSSTPRNCLPSLNKPTLSNISFFIVIAEGDKVLPEINKFESLLGGLFLK